MQPRLRQHYESQVVQKLADTFEFGNRIEIPKLEKIVINMGVGEATADSKKPAVAAEDLAAIDTAMEALNTAWQAASQDIYNAQQASGGAEGGQAGADGQPGPTTGGAEQSTTANQGKGDDEVTDVDFEEVK